MLKHLLDPKVIAFVKEHEQADLNQLILSHNKFPDIPVKEAVTQIQSRRKAKLKLPEWYKQEDVVFPPPLSMEQCSSEQAARYKAGLFAGECAVDLTGGAGVDSYYLSHQFQRLTYVEKEPELVDLARHNFGVLGASNIELVNATAEDFITEATEGIDLIYIDPARRKNGQKVFRWEDLQPDMLSFQLSVMKNAKRVLVKGAPLMDIGLSLKQLNNVEEVIVVAVENEVKELLFVLNSAFNGEINCRASNIVKNGIIEFNYKFSDDIQEEIVYGKLEKYLYEPNAAIMKSGGFNAVASQYNLTKLHPNTHLYTSNNLLPFFPGRTFEVQKGMSYDKKYLRRAFPDGKANITVRNFPETVAKIRLQTRLKEGGDVYLFAFTDFQHKRGIAVCSQLFNT